MLKNLVRDWSHEGTSERQQSHAPILEVRLLPSPPSAPQPRSATRLIPTHLGSSDDAEEGSAGGESSLRRWVEDGSTHTRASCFHCVGAEVARRALSPPPPASALAAFFNPSSRAAAAQELERWVPVTADGPPPSVLVPGAGLARLAVEIAWRGYYSEVGDHQPVSVAHHGGTCN